MKNKIYLLLIALMSVSGFAWENMNLGISAGIGSYGMGSSAGLGLNFNYGSGNGPIYNLPQYSGFNGGYIGSPIMPYGPAYQNLAGYGMVCTSMPQNNFLNRGYPNFFPSQSYPPTIRNLPIPPYAQRPMIMMPPPQSCNSGCNNFPMLSGGYGNFGYNSPYANFNAGLYSSFPNYGFGGGLNFNYSNASNSNANLIAAIGANLQGTSVMPFAVPRNDCCCTQPQPQPILLGGQRDADVVPRPILGH
jgi:hypothetical protein